MSPLIKTILCYFLQILEEIAKTTKNPTDDAIVKALKVLLNCD